MTVTFCNSGHVKLKAGTSATVLTDDQYTTLINEAEDFIIANIADPNKYDWIANYSSLTTRGKLILEDAASSHAAMAALNYDPDAIGKLAQFQTVMDFNYTRFTDCLGLLVKKATDFLRGV